MRIINWVFTAYSLGSLAACGTSPSSVTTICSNTSSSNSTSSNKSSTQKSSTAAIVNHYGATPGNKARTVIENYVERALQEPYTAKYRYVNEPVKGSHGGWVDMPVAYGYVSCVWINTTGNHGGNAGEELHFFLTKNDAVVRSEPHANWLCKPYM
ncbi:MAG TPA: hypothetical protein VIV27_07420 [Halioglobus sp.]